MECYSGLESRIQGKHNEETANVYEVYAIRPVAYPVDYPKRERERERGEIEVFHKVLVHFKSLVNWVINVGRKFWKLFLQTLIETKAKFITPTHSYFGPSSGYQTNLSGWLNWNPISCDNFCLVSTILKPKLTKEWTCQEQELLHWAGILSTWNLLLPPSGLQTKAFCDSHGP